MRDGYGWLNGYGWKLSPLITRINVAKSGWELLGIQNGYLFYNFVTLYNFFFLKF